MSQLNVERERYRSKTAEQLRLVLPLLSKHATDFGPESYALWFDFVNGSRLELTAELQTFVNLGTRLSKEQTDALYNTHLRDAESHSIENVREAFVELLTKMAASTAEVKQTTIHSQQFLETIPAEIERVGAQHAARQLAEQSQLVAATLLAFGQQLDKAQTQVDGLREELQSVRNEARIDVLTNLKNRRAFDEALAQGAERALAEQSPLTLVMIDVDRFKLFNDELGHVMGDKALLAVATVIQQNTKGKDFAARYGGEEFAVLLTDTPLESAQLVAENLRLAVERIRIRKVTDGSPVRTLTVSCGVAAFHPGEELTDFVDRADSALYAAKRGGRNKVVIATD
ncbi:MAG: GGDEF domain-containing protein [Herminiimonas sp.]|nr:GGDEF domain-containing protein [Herminiimonas sp.]